MKILLLSQVFWPDTASTSQHLTDLADRLAEDHEVRVFSSRYNYENTRIQYPKYEERKGIRITRINHTSFGKKNTLARVVDFFSFNFLLVFKLLSVNRKNTDLIIGMTSPPLVSFIGIFFSKIKGIDFHYWTMDLQPELSISSGLIRKGSLSANLFQRMGNYIFRHADKVIVLDKYMGEYAVRRGANEKKMYIAPVWPVVDELYTGARSDNPFRIQNGFGDKIVVMYSGNHSYIHPLDTLLQSVLELRNDERFLFVFIGGGVRVKDVTKFKADHRLQSIIQLEYQPRDNIHLSLGAADIQVVILGDNLVGYTHPNKIYGSMFIGKPILYIGPERSHIVDILDSCPGNILVKHNEAEVLVRKLTDFAERSEEERNSVGKQNRTVAVERFHPDGLKSKMYNIITGLET